MTVAFLERRLLLEPPLLIPLGPGCQGVDRGLKISNNPLFRLEPLLELIQGELQVVVSNLLIYSCLGSYA